MCVHPYNTASSRLKSHNPVLDRVEISYLEELRNVPNLLYSRDHKNSKITKFKANGKISSGEELADSK